jgi:hypothetical protein
VPRYKYRVFISHVWDLHSNHFLGLIRLLNNARHFDFKDIGVPRWHQIDGEAPMQQVLATLRTSDVVIVINTPALANRPNVLAELKEAEQLDIPIIAVTPRGRNGSRHEIIERARKAPWIGRSIAAAIKEAVDQSRILRLTASEITPTEEDAFELIEEAALEAPLTPEEVEEVRGEDEAPYQPTRSPSPRDVIFGGRQDDPTPVPPPTLARYWLNRIIKR